MWESPSESLGRVGVVLRRTVVGYDWRFDNLYGSHLQNHWVGFEWSWEEPLLVMTDVTTTHVGVSFRVIGSGLCSPEKDRCWLWLTLRQPVWKSFSESLGRVCVVLRRTVVGYDWRYDNLCGSYLQSHWVGFVQSWERLLLVMTDVSTTCMEVIFRVIGSGLCSPEKNCCWLWLTLRPPVWKSSSESLGRVCVVLRRTVVGYNWRFGNLYGSHLQSHWVGFV